MAATLNKFPTKLSPQAPDRSFVLLLGLSAPARNWPFDATHEHWPNDNFRTKKRVRLDKEHCPPEVYIG